MFGGLTCTVVVNKLPAGRQAVALHLCPVGRGGVCDAAAYIVASAKTYAHRSSAVAVYEALSR